MGVLVKECFAFVYTSFVNFGVVPSNSSQIFDVSLSADIGKRCRCGVLILVYCVLASWHDFSILHRMWNNGFKLLQGKV